MRPIKFRAWDKKLKVMSAVTLLDFNEWWIRDEHSGERNSFQNEETDRHILMQFTGLFDKNGKEIWESDILAKPRDKKKWDAGEAERITVEYNEKLTRFLCTFWTIYGGEGYSGNVEEQQLSDYVKNGWIVIGNIHSNPELLGRPK